MGASGKGQSDTGWSHRLFIVGAVLLLALNGVVLLEPAKHDVRDIAYVAQVMLGAVVGCGLLTLIVYGIARAVGKAKTPASRARLVFWTLGVLLLINLKTAAGLKAARDHT